jgi:hypothetical protein
MPKLKPETWMPTPEEEARINEGIALDPDSPEVTEEEFARARPAVEVFGEEFVKMMKSAKMVEVPDEVWNNQALWKEVSDRYPAL